MGAWREEEDERTRSVGLLQAGCTRVHNTKKYIKSWLFYNY